MDDIFDKRMEASEREKGFNYFANRLETVSRELKGKNAHEEVKDLAYALFAVSRALRAAAESGQPVTLVVLTQEPLWEVNEEGMTVLRRERGE